MADPLPIPTSIWTRLLAFLRGGHTGRVVLHVHRGTVRAASLEEQIREDEEPDMKENRDRKHG